MSSFVNNVLNSVVFEMRSFGHVVLSAPFRNVTSEMPYNELNIVLSGKGTVVYNKKRFLLVPGVYFFPSGGELTATQDSPMEKIFFQFRALYHSSEIFRGEEPRHAAFPKNRRKQWIAAAQSGDVLLAKGVLAEVVSLFHASLADSLRSKQERFAVYERFFRYVHEVLAADFKLEAIASEYGLSAKRFCAKFTEAIGMPPKQYYLQEKVNAIKDRLARSDETIAAVSERFGFADQFYFARFFKKMTGATPTEYRESALLKI
ncbi:MAG: AraC family transcriptional regulator [Spirochaetota bacterium]